MNETITYSKATGAEIKRIVELIDEALEGEEESHVNMACLVVALIIQCPNITAQQLVDGVRGASEWIALFGSGIEEQTDPKRMN